MIMLFSLGAWVVSLMGIGVFLLLYFCNHDQEWVLWMILFWVQAGYWHAAYWHEKET